MKKILLILILTMSHALFAASSSSGRGTRVNSSSWSLLYGYSKNVNEQNYRPGGQSYKLQLGNRTDSNLETNFFLRYASQKDDLTFSNIEGNIVRKTLSFGVNFGIWIFSAFNVHAGYAFHSGSSDVSGAYSTSQQTTINSNHGLGRFSSKGLLAGADLVLLQGTTYQFFTNYEYYHLNHKNSHDWEAMAGLRFYPGPSKSGGSPSFFSKLFDLTFNKK